MAVDVEKIEHLVGEPVRPPVGDALLQAVASRLKNCVREVDTIARMGGDEFTAILEGVSGEPDVAVVATRIIDSVRTPFEIVSHRLSIGVSIGVTLYPADDQNVDGLLKHADAAMYRAKQRGGDAFEFHRPISPSGCSVT